jgi:starch phosphorylase
VIPLYFNIGPAGYSPNWINMAKQSMASILPRFNASRMVGDYLSKFYRPAARQRRRYADSDYQGARAVAAWKTKVRASWHKVALRRIDAPVRRMPFGESLRGEVAVHLDGLTPDDVRVELLFGRPVEGGRMKEVKVYPLRDEGIIAGGNEHLYALEVKPELCGKIEYRLRVYPYHELLTHPFEMGMMLWL